MGEKKENDSSRVFFSFSLSSEEGESTTVKRGNGLARQRAMRSSFLRPDCPFPFSLFLSLSLSSALRRFLLFTRRLIVVSAIFKRRPAGPFAPSRHNDDSEASD